MRNRFVQAVLVLLFAGGCVASEDTQPAEQAATSTLPPLELQDCFEDGLDQPFGSGCPTLTAAECQLTDWDVLRDPVNDYACFGLSEHLGQCGNCNILNIPNWDLCKNKQYMDCLMSGHINNHGPLCFVTPPAEIPHAPPGLIKVTARESCYFYHQTLMWEPQRCPASASCCKCTGGTDSNGNPVSAWCNDPNVCGADFQEYDCVQGQWVATGIDCGQCQCTGGTDYLGNTVSRLCGETVCGADFRIYNCVNEQWVATTTACGGGGTKLTVSLGFGAMPTWSSTFNATWGGAALWSTPSGGQTGSFLSAARTGQGSSAMVKVFTITPNSTYTISIYMKGASSTANYWVEAAFRLGNRSAYDFDQNSGAWTKVKKFENASGKNGNGNVWTIYSLSFSSGANTQISVGFKTGSMNSTAPPAAWDTLRIQ